MNLTTSDTPVLYSFRRCPYAIRARLAIKYSGIKVELREISLKNKPACMLDISPKGTVPVLLLGDNIVIDESLDIMYWALSIHDPDNWLSATQTERAEEARDLIQHNDEIFKTHLDRYKYADRYAEFPLEYYRKKAEAFPAILNKKLQQSRFLHGNDFGLTDMAIFPFIRQFAMVDKAWFDQTNYYYLQKWLQLFLDASLFSQVMKKYPLWTNETSMYF
jgi:glutathione S-transferase